MHLVQTEVNVWYVAQPVAHRQNQDRDITDEKTFKSISLKDIWFRLQITLS